VPVLSGHVMDKTTRLGSIGKGEIMKKKAVVLTICALVAATVCLALPAGAQDAAKGCPTAESIGWHLGMQAWTFNKFSFYEAVDTTASLGLKWIEAFPGQRLSKDMPETVKFDENMSADLQKEVLAKLKSANVTVMNYGVVGFGKTEADARKLFDFAKAMGIKTIVSEPAPAALPMLDKLCAEYNITIAIHNHPKPSMYWDYKKVLDATKGLSNRIGSCSDTGTGPVRASPRWRPSPPFARTSASFPCTSRT